MNKKDTVQKQPVGLKKAAGCFYVQGENTAADRAVADRKPEKQLADFFKLFEPKQKNCALIDRRVKKAQGGGKHGDRR